MCGHLGGIPNLLFSEGEIKNIDIDNDYIFEHDASTLQCSLGSPIILKDSLKLVGVHHLIDKIPKNEGSFLCEIFQFLSSSKSIIECCYKNIKNNKIQFLGESFSGMNKNNIKIVYQFYFEENNIINNELDFKCFFPENKTIKITFFCNEKLTDCPKMFFGCKDFISVDLSGMKMKEVTYMNSMFYGCTNLEKIIFSRSNSKKVIDMHELFYQCENLKEIELFSNINTLNVKNMNYLFY